MASRSPLAAVTGSVPISGRTVVGTSPGSRGESVALTESSEVLPSGSRETLIWTKEQLLVPLPPGAEAPPHPMRLGDDEKDYYRLGAAGLTHGLRAPGNAGPGGPSGPAVSAASPDASLAWAPLDVREAGQTDRGEDR